KQMRSRSSDDASFAGLAEIEARRGRADEASRLLKLMVQRSTDNGRSLRLAAETAARIGRLADAIEFRTQIAKANPDDAANGLELIRVVASAGRSGEAVDQAAALISDRTSPNSIRAQAAEILGDILKADRSLTARAKAGLDREGRRDAAVSLARAVISDAAGNREES